MKGKFIEIIGNYNPTLKPKTLVIDKERALFWLNRGAKASDTVNNLLCNLGIIDKSKRIVKVHAKKSESEADKTAPVEEKTEKAEPEIAEATEPAAAETVSEKEESVEETVETKNQ